MPESRSFRIAHAAVRIAATWATVSLVLLVSFSGFAHAQHPASPALPGERDGIQFVDQLAGGEFPQIEARFDTTMAQLLPAERLATNWAQLQAQNGAFEKVLGATVEEDGGHRLVVVACQFQHARVNVLIAFDSAERIAGLFFRSVWTPPPYADTASFKRLALTVEDGRWKLPGALTVPHGAGPFPAVVLISGSGPTDMDETVFADKPFKDLAWGLASRGIVVLRYPKRTNRYGAASSLDPANLTVKDEYLDDAAAAVALLAHRPDVDPHHIYVVGHSEGGYLAPRIATGNAEVAGIVILAGNTRPLEDVTIDQLRYLLPLEGRDSASVTAAITKAEAAKRQMDSPSLKPGTMISDGFASLPSSYVLDLRGYDPAAVAATLKIPILVLQGARDYQVRLTDFDGWKRGLAGHPNVTFKLYPDLTHLFTPALTPGTGLSTPADYRVPENVARAVVQDIAAWIHAHSR
jgi:uncharacterized protein